MGRRGQFFGFLLISLWLAFLLTACSVQHSDQPRWLVLVTTRELDEAGLLDAVIPAYEQASGVHVKRLPLTTAKGLEYADLAGVDLLLLPAGAGFDRLAGPPPTYPPYSDKLYPTPTLGLTPDPIPTPLPGLLYNERRLALWSELVILGPANDPLHLQNQTQALTGFKLIAGNNARFDGALPQTEPGLAEAEKRLWNQLGRFGPTDRGSGYRQVAGDFGEIIRQAATDGAYTLVPLASYVALKDDGAVKGKLQLVLQNDIGLFLPYEVAVPNNFQGTDRDVALARSFVAFLTSQKPQSTIASFTKSSFSHPPYRPYYFPVSVAPL